MNMGIAKNTANMGIAKKSKVACRTARALHEYRINSLWLFS